MAAVFVESAMAAAGGAGAGEKAIGKTKMLHIVAVSAYGSRATVHSHPKTHAI